MHTEQNTIKSKTLELYNLLAKVFGVRELDVRTSDCVANELTTMKLLSVADDIMTQCRPMPFMENEAKKVPITYNVLAELVGMETRWSWTTKAYGGQLHLVFVRTEAD